jgi:hypothetical protein
MTQKTDSNIKVFGISQLNKMDAEIAHSKQAKVDAKLYFKAFQLAERKKEKITDL